MPTPDVIAKVRDLRAELAAARPASPEAARIATQIDTVLAEPAHAPHYEGLGDRLRAEVAGLEGEHPKVAAAMNSVINALLAAGV
ncbi:MAG TPA: DUF4404 family protein [Kofleriaceae bacterium]|nr:DUF4404 family protein [Kofleriaceae bacterium]